MAGTRKEAAVENLLLACAMGFLALIVTAVALLAQTGDVSRERAALSDLSGRPMGAVPIRVDDPAILRLYPVLGEGPRLFGASVSLESRSGVLLVVAIVASDGELQAIRPLDANSARTPFARADWFGDFLGKGGATAFPQSVSQARTPLAVSGATESFLLTGEIFGRLSNLVRAQAKEGK